MRRPPLLPYTTLFRSLHLLVGGSGVASSLNADARMERTSQVCRGSEVLALDELDDVGLVERLGVSGTVLTAVLGSEVRGSPVILEVNRGADVRNRIDGHDQLVVRNAGSVQSLTRAAGLHSGCADAVATPGVGLVLHVLVVGQARDRKSTRLNSSHVRISY